MKPRHIFAISCIRRCALLRRRFITATERTRSRVSRWRFSMAASTGRRAEEGVSWPVDGYFSPAIEEYRLHSPDSLRAAVVRFK